MANVFISYQRADTLLLAHCLRYALDAAGHRAFVDTGAIPAGSAFVPFIDEWIAGTDLFVVLIGPDFDFDQLAQANSAVAFEWRRARFHGCSVLPVLYEARGRMPATDRFPNQLRWVPALNAHFVSDASLSADVDSIVGKVPALAHAPRPSAHVLWIDDKPKNNVNERRHLRAEAGLAFDNVVSTEEAKEQLRNASYDLVITDLGRYSVDEHSHTAGLDALRYLLEVGGPPVIVYAGRNALELRDEVLRLGGFGSTNAPGELYQLIDQALGRTLPPDGTVLER
jgi:hypothetical protein